VIPGGGVVEGGEPAAAMRALCGDRDPARVALLGPNCMGAVDWTTNSSTYIGDVNPWLPRGLRRGPRPVGQRRTDAFLHAPGTRIGYSRIVSVGAEVVLDLCDYLAYCLDDPRPTPSCCSWRASSGRSGSSPSPTTLELGKPILAVKVGRSAQAQEAAIAHSGSLAGEDRVTTAALDAAG
jgi:acyl-CoA synthetase (NDP forming)